MTVGVVGSGRLRAWQQQQQRSQRIKLQPHGMCVCVCVGGCLCVYVCVAKSYPFAIFVVLATNLTHIAFCMHVGVCLSLSLPLSFTLILCAQHNKIVCRLYVEQNARWLP